MNSQLERNKKVLLKYIPEPAVDIIAHWVVYYNFKLKIKHTRSTKYGDYRPPLPGTNHQITINHDLNPFAFLITLVHEIAHLTNFNKHRNKVLPHGDEWKFEFKILMQPFLEKEIFPSDVKQALIKYLHNPAASSCSDPHLHKVLIRYDEKEEGVFLLESIQYGELFFHKEVLYQKGEKIRKRYRCVQVSTKRLYLFDPLAQVKLAN